MKKGYRNSITVTKDVMVHNTLSPIYNTDVYNAPHCVMERSQNEWKHVNNDSIHLGGYSCKKVNKTPIASYESITFGSYVIKMKKRARIIGNPIWWSEINLSQMKGKYVVVTTTKSEYTKCNNVICISTSSRIEENNKEESTYISSGVVVLCCCILDHQKHNTN